LRLRFEKRGATWHQSNAPDERTTHLIHVDLAEVLQADLESTIEAVANRLQSSLNLSVGPLVRMALLELGEHRPQRVLIIIHHLVVDGVSWRILLEDLQRAYEQMSKGEPIKLGFKTTSFKEWAEALTAYARSEACRREFQYWAQQARTRVDRLPVDYSRGENTNESARTITEKLSQEETKDLLQNVTTAYHAQVDEVLLAALLETFNRWTGTAALAVDLEGHGREEIVDGVNTTRTVGWFTSIYNVVLHSAGWHDRREALKSVKEQLRKIPNRGIGFGLVKYLSDVGRNQDELLDDLQAEVSFNYLGRFDHVLPQGALFAPIEGSIGAAHSPKGTRHHLIGISALVSDGQLKLAWSYSNNFHNGSTIKNLVTGHANALRSLIADCQSPDAAAYTPSDFPLAQIGQDEFDRVIGEVEFEGYER